jgi:hypothetical protein
MQLSRAEEAEENLLFELVGVLVGLDTFLRI